MASNKELAMDIPYIIQVYKDGTVKRFQDPVPVPPSPQQPTDGVFSKDIVISQHVSARLYLPKLTSEPTKLPILVYFHGGGFCVGSPFSLFEHKYVNSIAARSNALIVSVDYRLTPEHLLPAAYEDCWAALQWVAAHAAAQEPWLVEHGDFDKLYVGGDSAGANIVHEVAMRAGREALAGGVKILGGFQAYPYFWGCVDESMYYKCWALSYPDALGGMDHPWINPFVGGDGGRRLVAGLGCKRMLVVVAEKDPLRENGIKYYEALKEGEWGGEVELIDVEGEDHCFQFMNPDGDKAKDLIQRIAAFIV